MNKIIMFCLLSIFFLQEPAFGAFNFIDNGDGTVTDARTGLVWLKDANPCGYKNWFDAGTYCSSLASGMAGLTDGSTAGQWRLPTKTELEGIGTDPPATWEQYYPFVTWTMPGAPFTNVQADKYWSDTSDAGVAGNAAWNVNVGSGYVKANNKSSSIYYVWPVRGPTEITTTTTLSTTTVQPTTTIPKETTTTTVASYLINNKNGTVTDTRTNLVWLGNANPCGTKNWYDAGTYCASLANGQAGLTDGSTAGQWRLPSKTELEGIGTDPPATWESGYPSVTWTMPGAPFTGVQSHGCWSGTSYARSTDLAWFVYMPDGYVGSSSKSHNDGYVWPVRGPVTITTTIPEETTTTSTSNDNALVAININGNGKQDEPQPSGTLPGTSPSLINYGLYNYNSFSEQFIFVDRVLPPLDPFLTAKTKPTLFEKFKTKSMLKETYSEGEQKIFWIKDDDDQYWRQITATNRKSGVNCYIFIDDAISISSDVIDYYKREFDEVMFDVVSSSFGLYSDRDNNGKATILLYNMHQDTSQGIVTNGYFYSVDYFADSDAQQSGLHSNEMDIIYIRGNPPDGWDPAQQGAEYYQITLTTLIHEFQHLTNFGITFWQPPLGKDGFADTWINEMMSMAAETMYFKEKLKQNPSYTHPSMLGAGNLKRRIENYNDDLTNSIRNGHGLTYWDSQGDIIANYSLAYIFGQYVSIHSTSGQSIFKDILNYMITNTVFDYTAVSNVVSQNISSINSWENLLKNWAIANMANEPTGLYGYKGQFTLTPHGPTSSQVNIHNGGAVYRSIDSDFTAPSDAGPNCRFYTFTLVSNATTTSSIVTTTTTSVGGGGGHGGGGGGAPTTTTSIPIVTTTIAPQTTTTTVQVSTTSSVKPTTTSSAVTTTVPQTTTTTVKQICPGVLVSANNSTRINLLHQFRDRILLQTAEGREYVRLFYNNQMEIAFILLRNAETLKKAKEIIESLMPEIELTVQNNSMTISKEMMNRINGLLTMMSTEASPELKAAIEKVQKELIQGEAFKKLGIETK